jgi:hypothetical protein
MGNMLSKINELFPTSDFRGVALISYTRTPAISFAKLVWEPPGSNRLLVSNVRIPFDEDFAERLVVRVNSACSSLAPYTSLTVVDGSALGDGIVPLSVANTTSRRSGIGLCCL